MSILSVRIDTELEKKLEFLMKQLHIEDKSSLIRKLLNNSLDEEIIHLLGTRVEKGEITLWKASEVAGISLERMIRELQLREISLYDDDMLEEDLRYLKSEST